MRDHSEGQCRSHSMAPTSLTVVLFNEAFCTLLRGLSRRHYMEVRATAGLVSMVTRSVPVEVEMLLQLQRAGAIGGLVAALHHSPGCPAVQAMAELATTMGLMHIDLSSVFSLRREKGQLRWQTSQGVP